MWHDVCQLPVISEDSCRSSSTFVRKRDVILIIIQHFSCVRFERTLVTSQLYKPWRLVYPKTTSPRPTLSVQFTVVMAPFVSLSETSELQLDSATDTCPTRLPSTQVTRVQFLEALLPVEEQKRIFGILEQSAIKII